jgi:O-succinylbenzoic acid--CoA ligase
LNCSLRVTDRAELAGWQSLSDLVTEAPVCFRKTTLTNLDLDLTQPATILFSSGSTGIPKAVLHSLANHHYSAWGSHENILFAAADTWLVSLPLYHMGGLALAMRALLHGGGLAFPEPGESLPAAVRRTGATHLSLVPTQLSALVPAAGGLDLKAVLVGGAACDPHLVREACAVGLPVFLTYGSTEMCSQVTTTLPGQAAEEPACSGRVLSHREIHLAEDGEIRVRGATRFSGYITSGGLETPFDQDGWFATGDIGCLDKQGRLFVLGRKDTMFISGGENVYPEEIEGALIDRLRPEACVVVPVVDETYGQRPVAFVKTDEPLPVRDDLALNLERFKWPDRLYPWPEGIPASAKPDRVYFGRLALEMG